MPIIDDGAAPHYQDATVSLFHGDCLDVLRSLPDNSVDAVCTDPPYGLANTDPAHVTETLLRWVNGERDYMPGGAGFMGKAWDAFVPPVAVWDDCLRVLKPGGHVLAFAGSRTMDLMTLSLRLAGFEIRDSIAWLYGSGFPKSLDVSKAIDRARDDRADVLAVTSRLADLAKAAGITRADLDAHMGTSDMGGWWLSRLPHRCACPSVENWTRLRDFIPGAPALDAEVWRLNGRKGAPGEAWGQREVIGERGVPVGHAFAGSTYGGDSSDKVVDITAPATPAAVQWQGWGTALKPAFEPVVVARKPLVGTVAGNILAHGTGALNIDGCRVGTEATLRPNGPIGYHGGGSGGTGGSTAGRWPANVVLDESQAAALDEQSGYQRTGTAGAGAGGFRAEYVNGAPTGGSFPQEAFEQGGGASRFFYIAREDGEPCPSHEPANTVGLTSSQPSAPADSAPSGAATSGHLGTESQTDSPSTSGTPSASRPSGASDTAAMRAIGSESSPDWQPAKPSPKVSPARRAASLSQTGTTTTTTSPSISDGSAAPVTSSTTPSSAPGVPLDGLGSRFIYVAKADQSERPRVGGTAHPTVKPLDLMRWLVRLVTPSGGTVLEPFAGSGTTVEACIVEGFRCVAIEREADYLPLIEARIARRRDPVKAITLAGEDLGLFGEAIA